MAHIPDERFKNTLYDVEDCLDAITDFDLNCDFMKDSEKKKAVKMFRMFLDFCVEADIISGFNLSPLYYLLGLEEKIQAENNYIPTDFISLQLPEDT